MNLLLSPTLWLILSSTYFRSLYITVLHQRGSTNSNSLIKSNLLIFNETAFPEVFLALLLLLRLIVCDVGGVAPLVVGVVTLHNIIVLSLLNHLNLVNTFLSSSSNSSKASIRISLTLVTSRERLGGSFSIMLLMMSMVMIMIMIMVIFSIEGECTS